MPADPNAIFREWQTMRDQQANFLPTWQDLAEFFVPYQANITTQTYPGIRKTGRLYDSAGVQAAKQLASQIHGTFTPGSQRWFSLRIRQRELQHVKPIGDWLDEVADRTYDALNASNFAAEVPAVYLALPVFGTSGLYLEEKDPPAPNQFGGLRFTALTIGSYVIGEDRERRVVKLTRKFQLPVREVMALWKDTVSEGVRSKADTQSEAPVDLLHAVYERPEKDRQGRRAKPWASCYLEFDTKTLLAEGGYEENPYAVARWDRDDPSTPYGNGPGLIAYPDVRTLNQAVQLKLAAWEKALDPPLLAKDDGVLGSLSLEAAAINTVSEFPGVVPLESKARFDVNSVEEARLERKIDGAFFGPQVREITKDMTATEALIVKEEILRLMGPAAGRIQSEMLAPMIERAIALQYRARALPPIPYELANVGFNVDIDVIYEGPLARAQRATDLQAIDRKNAWVLSQQQLGNMSVGDLFDLDAEGRHVAEVSGYPPNLLRGADQVAAIRQQRKGEQMQQKKMAALSGMADAAGKAAPMVQAVTDAQQAQSAA